MTQKQVSELTGIKIRTISKYEHDAFEKPRISILEKLASFYQVPLSEIIHKGD
jgi:transcriptional regulator with XRE-family HTH domain